MLKERWKTISLFIYITDLCILGLALWVSYLIVEGTGGHHRQWAELAAFYVIAALTWSGLFFAFHLYEPFRVQPVSVTVLKVMKISVVGAAWLTSTVWLLNGTWVPFTLILVFSGVSLSLLGLTKVTLRLLASQIRWHGYNWRNLVIAGSAQKVQGLVDQISSNSQWGLRHVACLVTDGRLDNIRCSSPHVGSIDDLEKVLDTMPVDEVIFVISPTELNRLDKVFLMCEEQGVTTKVALSLFPHLNARPHLEELHGLSLVSFTMVPQDRMALRLKRIIDIAGSVTLLSLLMPAMALAAMAIKATSKGPVLFKQKRVGRNGRTFILYKFRSMHVNAAQVRGDIAARNELKGPIFKVDNDPRITAVGRWLRRTSFDEIPQLINVLKGDMSLVGPRPPLPEEINLYERCQRRRLSVGQGLTGLWQVNGRNRISDFNERLKLDLAYIDNWSLGLDLRIMLKTIPAVIFGRGAS